MTDHTSPPDVQENPTMMATLGWAAIAGCVIFALSILIADFFVPDHDWMADTISDLGAGEHEMIVDVGMFAYAGSVIATALLAAHVHFGGRGWSLGVVSLAALGLIIMVIGARNEYGDTHDGGVVIHIYLVYALGVLMTAIPLLMAPGIARAGTVYRTILWAIAGIWAVSAPIFFMLPDAVDGVYERYLGLIAFALTITISWVYIQRARQKF